ncbi:RNA polymerase sigma factor [Ideonella sp. YS5]|uniref:RNA polymerase sigma factor n=1 Tax=Ideonella sp. YS5 TaxID=3453714 RepID=UPI003EE9BA00
MTESRTAVCAHREGEDRELASRVASGDRQAFEGLMRQNNRRLYRLARATLRDDAEAEDALQEAYLAAYHSIGRYRGDAALSTWLSHLVLNECLGRLRRARRRDNIVPIRYGDTVETEGLDAMEAQKHAPDEALGRAEARALIERRLDQLPEDFRVVFVLRSVEELSVEETAQCLGIPEATVRSRHFRARSLLRASLAQDFDLAERDVFSFGGAHCDRIVGAVLSRLAAG